jgi:hypothetical protein
MKRLGIVFVLCMLLLGMVLVVGNEKTEGMVNTHDPTDNETWGVTNPFTTPENAYASDDSYAYTFHPTLGVTNSTAWVGFGITDKGTEISKVEVGIEAYFSTPADGAVSGYVVCSDQPTGSNIGTITKKAADDDTLEWIDVTSDPNCGTPWTWDDFADGGFKILFVGSILAGDYFYIDYMSVRITHSGSFHIQMLNPTDRDTVHNTIDFVAKVTNDIGEVIDEVTFYFNSLYHVAELDENSGAYIYREFNTWTLNNAYYTLVARANTTTGLYSSRTIQFRVQNAQDKGCYFDDTDNIWVCPQNHYYTPDRGVGFGNYEVSKGFTTTYWEAFYWYTDVSNDALTHALYAPLDSTYTDNEVIIDWVFIDDYASNARCWTNDTKSSASTADDTILENDTRQIFQSLSGQNVTITCSDTTDAERWSRIFIADDFSWGVNTATNQYTYSFSFTNNLPGTMKELAIGIPFKIAADVESVEVWDVGGNAQLNAQRDYRVTQSSVEVGIQTLAASSTAALTITFSPYVTGTDILKPTMTILESDIETDPVIRNSHTYNRAYKTVYNSNNRL